MGIQYHQYHVALKDELGSVLGGRITSGVVIEVRVAGTKEEASTGTLATLYSDPHGQNSLTNPISGSSFTDFDRAEFFTSTAAVDIVVRDYGDATADDFGNRCGRYAMMYGVTPRSSNKTLLLPRSSTNRVIKIPFLATGTDSGDTPNTWDNAEASCVITAGSSSTIKLCKGLVISDAVLQGTTVDSGTTMDLGLLSSESGGDADGFFDGISMAAAGWITAGVTKTMGSNADYYASTTRGAFLATFSVGADTSVATIGQYDPKNFYADSVVASTVSITGSSGINTAAGYAYLVGYVGPFVEEV